MSKNRKDIKKKKNVKNQNTKPSLNEISPLLLVENKNRKYKNENTQFSSKIHNFLQMRHIYCFVCGDKKHFSSNCTGTNVKKNEQFSSDPKHNVITQLIRYRSQSKIKGENIEEKEKSKKKEEKRKKKEKQENEKKGTEVEAQKISTIREKEKNKRIFNYNIESSQNEHSSLLSGEIENRSQINGNTQQPSQINISFKLSEITLHFQDLHKSIKVTTKTKRKWCLNRRSDPKISKLKAESNNIKQILTNANGAVLPGEIMAIFGPSGSGKTTLLNILACRNMDGVTGTVHINSHLMTKAYKRKIGYVLQDDIFFTNLTLREQLIFTAFLKLSGNKSSKLNRVEEILTELTLSKCADTKILLLSGGEKKRLSIGTELLTSPSLLYFDEPTSGLDSASAFSLIKTLRKLANYKNKKKTIVASIHQPSSQIYESFDKIMLLSSGHTIYSGTPHNAIGYFEKLGHKCPGQYNPADFLLDLANNTSIQCKLIDACLPQKELGIKVKLNHEMHNLKEKKFPTSWCEQFQVLLKRSGKNAWSKLVTKMNWYKCFGLSLSISFCFWRMPFHEKHTFDRTSLIFLILMFWPMDTLFMGLMAWPSEKEVIMRERASGMYRLSSYFMAKTVASMPAILILPTIFLLISYLLCGLNPSLPAFIGMLGVVLLSCLSAESWGMFLSASIPDFKTASTVCLICMVVFLCLGGFFIKNITPWVTWVKYLTVVYYPYQAGLSLEFDKRTLICDGSSKLKQCEGKETVYGGDIIKTLGGEISLELSIFGIIAIGLISRLLAYLALRFLSINQGRK